MCEADIQSGTGEKIAQYWKLIESACDGALPKDDLDSVVDQLLEVSLSGMASWKTSADAIDN